MYKVLGADGKEYGPVSADQIRQWITEHRLNGQSLIQPEGGTGWRPLLDFPELAGGLVQAVPAPMPAPLPTQRPGAVGATNPMATTSLVLGLLSWTCCGVGMLLSVLGLVFGFIALSQIKAHPGQGGRELAMAGIVLSACALVANTAITLFAVLGQGMRTFSHGSFM